MRTDETVTTGWRGEEPCVVIIGDDGQPAMFLSPIDARDLAARIIEVGKQVLSAPRPIRRMRAVDDHFQALES